MMPESSGTHFANVIKFAQSLLADHDGPVTPAVIGAYVDQVLAFRSKWSEGLDRTAVIAELLRRSSMWVGADTNLSDETGHDRWLNAQRKADWRYWQRYREWIEAKLPEAAIDALDRSTDNILGQLEDPRRAGSWDRRGLVVGHVQSGKTGNYTGLICKAADAGYKIIIVLAGIHNNLRAQTQIRLDEGFLGYETHSGNNDLRLTGVGHIDADLSIKPNAATDRTERGDFNATNARNYNVSPEARPWLFVVKKNKTVLERINRWVRNHVANATDAETGRKIVTNIPILIIDDEADNASVDTGEQLFDEDGRPDLEHEPKTINRLIRTLLHSFSRSAYIGYTATPFANIFIHEKGRTTDEGPDLFPSSFIVNLAAPSNYVGPEKIFGTSATDEDGLPLVTAVDDFADENGGGWMPLKHKNGHRPEYEGEERLPPSLERAIRSFMLACTARDVRGQGADHASMLVHVTRFTQVQGAVARQVQQYLRECHQRLRRNVDSASLWATLEREWKQDFMPVTDRVGKLLPDEVRTPETWDAIRDRLPTVIQDIDVRRINGTAKDALDYAENGGVGLKIIAVGGDKLARGLTLEGLTTSYFLRSTKMYDTLMQMGRWFGYRPAHLDLCRLYTTAELIEWYQHISAASEELREEFDMMAASGGTPRDYGLKVQSHGTLMVTSRVKMRSARTLRLSFSGQLLETVVFHADPETRQRNLAAGKALINSMGAGIPIPQRTRGGSKQEWNGQVWEDVPASEVIPFLQTYQTHRDAFRVVSPVLAEFVQKMALDGELTTWTVVLIGAQGNPTYTISNAIEPGMIVRKSVRDTDKFSIGRLMSPRDETVDLTEAQWMAALQHTKDNWNPDAARNKAKEPPETPSGPSSRAIRGFGAPGVKAEPEKGLLLLYLIDPEASQWSDPKSEEPALAFGISFPGSNTGPKIEYKVGNTYWEQVNGDAL